MTSRYVELRSDTFTRPTPSMRRAMYEAEVGDDVWGEDPTVIRLEEESADLMGKEAGLFVTSGTQGNLVGLLSHTRPGQEVIVGDQSHIFRYEVAGGAVIGGLQFQTVPDSDGCLDSESVRLAIREDDIHEPETGCVALENTHNRGGGAVMPREHTKVIADIVHAYAIPVHLDGARIFNACVALGTPVRELAEDLDSVTFCLTKGLGAPVGSVLCGKREYIERARRWRKMLGGGLRQVGVLAAAGLVALHENIERLVEDHANARLLGEGLANMRGIRIDLDGVQSNMVMFDIGATGIAPPDFIDSLGQRGVRLGAIGRTKMRAVTSYEVTREDIVYSLDALAQIVGQAVPAFA